MKRSSSSSSSSKSLRRRLLHCLAKIPLRCIWLHLRHTCAIAHLLFSCKEEATIAASVVATAANVRLPSGTSSTNAISAAVSFGTLMTATLDWKGIPAYVISLARGFSVIVGITATVIYPIVHSWISTLRTGLWSIWMQDQVPDSNRSIVGGVQNSLGITT